MKGNLTALFTIIIWGTTFVSTKVLLVDFKPIEILFIRFVLGLLILCIMFPKKVKFTEKGIEKYFVLAGLLGVCLYYLLENISLTYTTASNVGIIISTAPFFTALINKILYRNQVKIRYNFYLGFAVSIVGIVIISLSDGKLEFNIIGDLLAVAAALVWGMYSVVMDKISSYNYNNIAVTRRIFFWGILFMIPALFIFDFNIKAFNSLTLKSILNLLYLGVGASAICFVTWNYSVKRLGSIKTSVYIYLVPVITVIASVIILNEKLTLSIIIGTLLTVSGLFISQLKGQSKNGKEVCNHN